MHPICYVGDTNITLSRLTYITERMEFFRDTQNNLKIAFLNEAPARSYPGKKKGFLIVNCSLFLVYVIIFTGNEINPKAFVRSTE